MSPKKVPYQKEMSSSKHNFSGGMLVFVGVVLLFRPLGLGWKKRSSKVVRPWTGTNGREERFVFQPSFSGGSCQTLGIYIGLFFDPLNFCCFYGPDFKLIFDLQDHFLTKFITIWWQNLHCMDCFSHPLWKFLRKPPSSLISRFDPLKEWILGGSS